MKLTKAGMIKYIQSKHVVNMCFINCIGKESLRNVYNKLKAEEAVTLT